MLTLGVDLAAQPERTAACLMHWGDTPAIKVLAAPADDDEILRLGAKAEKIAIDAPLGWPKSFVSAIAEHWELRQWPEVGPDYALLRYRETDRWVRDHLKSIDCSVQPLSVSSDRIAVSAFRAARLLARTGWECSRDGSGKVVEVYPAAALAVWRLPHRGYKGQDDGSIEKRRLIVQGLGGPWLPPDGRRGTMALIASDHALDAFVAALVARASARGLCHPIPEEHQQCALREGWIHLPTPGSLSDLCDAGRR